MGSIKEYETLQEMYLDVPKDGVGVEIGVCKGMNSINLWHITKPFKMYLCDIWEERHPNLGLIEEPRLWEDDHEDLVGALFSREINDGKVELIKKWGATFLSGLEYDSLDWAYIDACHDYKPISMEIDQALLKVKKGGLIMGHDYVTNCQVWRAGVIRAVNERIQSGDMKMIGITIEKFPSYMCEVL